MSKNRLLVAGAGGFIGGWLANKLLEESDNEVIAVDLKPLEDWCQINPLAENLSADLKLLDNCLKVTQDVKTVYNLAADMGGMGFIENNKALCMLSVLINTHLLEASRSNSVQNFFFASSACVYNQSLQKSSDNPGLKEEDAYPADPEDGYGWEKLFSERMCRHFMEDFGINTRIARFHNVYGHYGTWDGGREKAPAAICRKIAKAKISGNPNIEIWGDGKQTRSFTYITDTITGICKLMESPMSNPINLGSDSMVTINQLVDIVEEIAGIKVNRTYDLSAPKGVRGRNSNNELIQKTLNWSPSVGLHEGLTETYKWIYDQIISGSTSRG